MGFQQLTGEDESPQIELTLKKGMFKNIIMSRLNLVTLPWWQNKGAKQ